MSIGHKSRVSVFDEDIDKLQAELVELRLKLVNSRADLEAILNDTNSAPRDMRTKVLIVLSSRLIELHEIHIEGLENNIRSKEALKDGSRQKEDVIP